MRKSFGSTRRHASLSKLDDLMDSSIRVSGNASHSSLFGRDDGWDEELGYRPSTTSALPIASTEGRESIAAPQAPISSACTCTCNCGTSIPPQNSSANRNSVNHANDFERFESEIQSLEMRLNTWREVSGMHTMKVHLEKMNQQQNLDVNDVTLTAINGINRSSQQSFDGVLETAVVAALLMTFSVPMAVNPPDFIQWKDDNLAQAANWQKYIHLYGWSIMSILGMMIIMYARVYTTAISRAARDSDRLRIQMTGNAFTEILYMLSAMTHFFGWGLFADVSAVYGITHGIILTCVAYGGVMLSIHWAMRFVRAGHIEYGWRANGGNSNDDLKEEEEDPIDDFIAFQLLEKKMEYATFMQQHGQAKSIFEWNHHNDDGDDGTKKRCLARLMFELHAKGANGLSADGQQLFGIDDKNNKTS